MTKGRLEAFSDGVIAIIITIMVLELKVPSGTQLSDLAPMLPIFICYALSFIYVGIYWNNHHHLFQAVHRVSGAVLWSNLHLLFWMSLVPLSTAWMGGHGFAPIPVALYGVNLLLCGAAYYVLVRALVAVHERDSALVRAVGDDRKGRISMVLYAFGIASACYFPWIAYAVYIGVALMWLIPDRRIERVVR
jgi:uncharacterized membrane protein